MSAPEKQELLPCPFCGGEDLEINHGFVKCFSCVSDGPFVEWEEDATRSLCLEKWNTRAPIKPKAGGVNLSLTPKQSYNAVACVTNVMNRISDDSLCYSELVDLLTVIQSQSKESSNDS